VIKKRKYFGTNGVRGIVGELFTPLFVAKMTSAIAAFIKNKGTVVVGSDARLSSPFIKRGVISTLLASGVEVIDVGTVPTPLTQFAVRHLAADLGVMITASHNPPQFNGLKIISADGIEIGVQDQLAIEEIFDQENFTFSKWNNIKHVSEMNLKDEYIEQILNQVDYEKIEKQKLKVVVDAGNGVGGLVTPYLLKKMGVKVFSVNAQLDGRFPGRGSEPSPSVLGVMGETVKQIGADFAVAHDGDADRAIFANEKGEIYWGDKSIALFEQWVLDQSKNKTFVTPVSSSMLVSDIASKVGGKVVWTPVGCIYVSRKMVEVGAIIGGEENGGLFYEPHIPVRDGAMATALMSNILAHEDRTLSDLIKALPSYHQKKDKIPCPNKLKEKAMQFIAENVGKAKDIITIDGVKLIYEDGWILIRPSGTEPIFRIFVEATTYEKAEKMMTEGKELVKKALKSITK